MAKVAFSKLGLKKTEEVEVIEWNEQKIEVKQYLPIEDKLDMIANIINQSADYNGYYNPARIYIFTILYKFLISSIDKFVYFDMVSPIPDLS